MLSLPVSNVVHRVGYTNIYSAIISLGRSPSDPIRGSFSPLSLFSSGVNGAWYDPSDLTTLYRDAAGTTPVTAMEQPVGLMLDKSKGLVLGPELMVFTSNPSSYTFSNSSGASVNNSLEVTKTAANGICAISLITVPGKSYKLTVLVRKGTVTENSFRLLSSSAYLSGFHNNASPNKNGGVLTLFFSATSATSWIYIQHYGVQLGTFYVDNISVRELLGNHAFNSSDNSANFPVLSARYNLLTKTEQFDDAAWVETNIAVTANAVTAPDGTTTAYKLIANTTNSNHETRYLLTGFTSGISYTQSVYAKAGEYRYLYLIGSQLFNGGKMFDLLTGTEFGTVGTAPTSSSIVSVGNGWYLCSITYTSISTGGYINAIGVSSNGVLNTISTGDGTSGIYIWGADLRVANDALNQPTYQRVNTASDYDTVGFKPYLKFNGTNQWLQTNSIDFSYGDKMFVSAGVRKLSDASLAILAELSANYNTNNGSFFVTAPDSINFNGNYGSASRGNAVPTAGHTAPSSTLLSPITSVLSATHDIIGDLSALRINGSPNGTNGIADKGAGNFGNYPLYVGARAGASLWFNGRLYQMVVAGKQPSAAEITSTETYINQKTGAY